MEDKTVHVEFNRQLQLVFCLNCNFFIKSDEGALIKHLKQVHHCSKEEVRLITNNTSKQKEYSEPLSDSESRLRSMYLTVSEEGFQIQSERERKSKLPALENVPTFNGKKCRKCGRIFKNDKQAADHKRQCIDKEWEGATFDEVKIQTIFGGKSVKFFEVSVNDHTCETSWLFQNMKEIDCVDSTCAVSDDSREQDSYLSTMKFNLHLQNYKFSLEEACTTCKWSSALDGEEFEKQIFSSLKDYFNISVANAKENMYLKTHMFLGSKLHLLVEKATIHRYQLRLLPLIYFLLNTYNSERRNPIREKRILSNEVSQLINKYIVSLKDQSRTLECIHSLMFQIFFSNETDNIQVIPMFIACCSIQQEKDDRVFRYKTAIEMSPLMAAMLYFIRCVVVNHVYGSGRTTGMVDGKCRTISEGWEQITLNTSENSDCAATYVNYCMKACNSIRYGDMSSVRFITCMKPGHLNCGILDGHELSLSTLGGTVKSIQKQMGDILKEKLMLGFYSKVDDTFWDELSKLNDHFTNRTSGYCFLVHPSNQTFIEKWRKRFSSFILKTNLIKGKGFDFKRVGAFLKDAEEFIIGLFWLLQVTSGGPGRCTEISQLQVQNGGSAGRHLFLRNGKLFYVTFYHKGREKKEGEGKPVARFPDSKTSDILLLYLIFVRAIESVIIHKLELHPIPSESTGDVQNVPAWNSSLFLFSHRGVNIEDDMLRRGFARIMTKTGCSMNVRQYRQYYSGVVKAFVSSIAKDCSKRQLQEVDHLHLQCCHSIETANQSYGVGEQDMRKLDGSLLDNFLSASTLWHEALNIGNIASTELYNPDRQQSLIENGENYNHLKKDVNELLGNVRALNSNISVLFDHIKNIHNRELDRVILEGAPKIKKPKVDVHIDNRFSRAVLLNCLRQLVKKEDASFRGVEQERAITVACNPVNDGLFILPTGEGKSMTYFIPSLLNQNKVTVVIVPLVALRDDILGRCLKLGIQASKWEERYVAGARLVIASAEHVLSDSFRSFVEEYANRNELHAIFIDEAHLFLQWQDFRPILNLVKKKLRPGQVNIRIIGLTATCPPSMEQELCHQIALKNPEIIRRSSSRNNLSYNVKMVTREKLITEVSEIIRTLSRSAVVNENNSIRMIAYCLTRDDCTNVCQLFKFSLSRNISIFMYHAGMEKEQRKTQFDKWKTEECWSSQKIQSVSLMVATSAFGCGVDIPDVKAVYHIGLPRNIISFLQESGRAGRNGESAFSVVLVFKEESEQDIDLNIGVEDKYHRNMEEGVDSDVQLLDMYEQSSVLINDNRFGNMEEWVNTTKGGCRRTLLDRFIDGTEFVQTCEERGVEQCDLCILRMRDSVRSEILDIKLPDRESTNGKSGNESMIFPDIQPRRLFFSPTNKFSKDGNVHGSPNQPSSNSFQSQPISSEDLSQITSKVHTMCAVCSIMKRKTIIHRRGPDLQEKSCYKNRCLKCASQTHSYAQCFMNKLCARTKGCYQCSFVVHMNEKMHPEGTYGRRTCPNKNSVRLIIVAFQDAELKTKMGTYFQETKTIDSEELLVEWLRKVDENGHLKLAEMLDWIFRDVISY